MACEQALKAQLEIRFGVALFRTIFSRAFSTVSSATSPFVESPSIQPAQSILEAQSTSSSANAFGRITMASWPLANSRYCQPFWRLTHSWVGTKGS